MQKNHVKEILLTEAVEGEWVACFDGIANNRLYQMLVILMGYSRDEAYEDLYEFLEADSDEDRKKWLPLIQVVECAKGETE